MSRNKDDIQDLKEQFIERFNDYIYCNSDDFINDPGHSGDNPVMRHLKRSFYVTKYNRELKRPNGEDYIRVEKVTMW